MHIAIALAIFYKEYLKEETLKERLTRKIYLSELLKELK
jgi:hypothetical protein